MLKEYYKKELNFEGHPTLVEVPQLKEVFPGMDKIYVCEEMKIIFLMEMVPVYGDKELEVTLYGDYELSPYFNGKFQTNEPILKAKYKIYTDKLVKS